MQGADQIPLFCQNSGAADAGRSKIAGQPFECQPLCRAIHIPGQAGFLPGAG